MEAAGLDVLPGEHPIVPVMLGDAALAGRMAEAMLAKGVYVIGFSYPVVPKGKARIRAQVSAAHTRRTWRSRCRRSRSRRPRWVRGSAGVPVEVRVEPVLEGVEPGIHPRAQRVDAGAECIDPTAHRVHPRSEEKQAAERRGGQEADRRSRRQHPSPEASTAS